MAKKLTILGAGLSGLATGFYVKNTCPDLEISILEKNAYPGGVIQTHRYDGFVFERGPRGIRPSGKGASFLTFAQELGLVDRIIPASQNASIRYLYLYGRLRKLSLLTLLGSPLGHGIISTLIKEWLRKPEPSGPDESVQDFFTRHIGARLTTYLIDPFVTGTWAGDPSQLGINSTFPTLAEHARQSGSLLRGWAKKKPAPEFRDIEKSPLVTLQGGMNTLIQTVADQLSSCIQYNTTIQTIKPENTGFSIQTDTGTLTTDYILSTIPAPAIASILSEHPPELTSLLKQIRYAPIITVSLGFEAAINPYPGFGYLVPSSENQPVLGVIFNDQTFPGQTRNHATNLTVMMGGAKQPQLLSLSEAELTDLAIQTVKEHLKIKKEPIYTKLEKIPHALPQYGLNHQALIDRIQNLCPKGLQIGGNVQGGVSIPDIITTARKTAQRFTTTG